ncbi:ketopantoate reductase family protein [Streptomyces liangshanensis]|uniref:ketopantoate reductase family protein n=1 Tax=Streptomyces liangshanensis TaxID=2717324 RepID=UPI0036D89A3F
MQNGIDGAERVRRMVPYATVVPALVYIQAARESPGRVRLNYNNGLEIPADREAERVRALFGGSGVEVRPRRDLTTAAWLKLMLNVATNSLTTLTLRPMEVFEEERIRELALGLMRETAAVGAAEGARLTEEDVRRTLESTSVFATGGTSMLHDRLADRPLEYETLNGTVVALAERHGIDVPLNRAVTALLGALRPLPVAKTAPPEAPARTVTPYQLLSCPAGDSDRAATPRGRARPVALSDARILSSNAARASCTRCARRWAQEHRLRASSATSDPSSESP